MDWKVKAVRTPKRRCWYEKSKVCYDKKSAITAANLRFKQDKIKLRAYWCDKCNFWHLTKQYVNEYPEGKPNAEEVQEETAELQTL